VIDWTARSGGPSQRPPIGLARLQDPAQFFYGEAGIGEDSTQGSLRDIPPGVHWNGGTAPVGVSHDVMAARHPGDLEPGSF
jgi:hypothetical protein